MIAALFARLPGLLAFAALAWVAVAAELAPARGATFAAPAPDLLFCVATAFAARRPACAPALLVFMAGLARDALGGGPFGLGALALLMAVEGARRSARTARRSGFAFEWARAMGWAALGLAAMQLALVLTAAPTPTAGALALRLGATALAYPLVRGAIRLASPTLRAAPPPSASLSFARRVA